MMIAYSEDLSISTLLRSHRVRKLPIESDDNYQRMVVSRRAIFDDAMHFLKNYFSAGKYLRITFSFEPAVDRGGLIREFFTLLIKAISRNNSIFSGPIGNRTFRHNMTEQDKKTYYYVGVMIGLSLIYGGPAPKFFSQSVANYIVNAGPPSIFDIPDSSIKEKLIEVCVVLLSSKIRAACIQLHLKHTHRGPGPISRRWWGDPPL